MSFLPRNLCLTITCLLAAGSCPELHGQESDGVEFFEKKIRPVLVKHCYECHSTAVQKPKGELLVDSREAIRNGGETGAAVTPGDIAKSLLIDALRYESVEMPPTEKLPDEVIKDFEYWIKIGAPDPREKPDPVQIAKALWDEQFAQRQNWWSLQPVTNPPIPVLKNNRWSGQPIDRFVLAKLREAGLQPVTKAERHILVRRLSFALTGLAPSAETIDVFVADESPDAWPKLVDQYMVSPHFGEHWARHWMDVVRYSDTYGYEWDIDAKGAWRYRDYLTRAFNKDVSYQQLVMEQIAGDLLDEPRIDQEMQINESLIGPMFYQLGEKRHGDSSEFNGIHQEMLDNKIDAFSKAFQALTISCARCHDHKLDAISQQEYYALAGVFISSRWVTNTADLPERNAAVIAELRSIKTQLRSKLGEIWLRHSRENLDQQIQNILADLREKNSGKDQSAEILVEDPLHLLAKISLANDENINAVWTELATRYSEEITKRKSENKTHFKLIADFSQGVPDGWSIDGAGIEFVGNGEFTVELSGDQIVNDVLPAGLFTASISPRLNGALRSPYTRNFDAGHISFEAYGGDFAAYRTVYDNAFLTEKQVYLNNAEPKQFLLATVHNDQARRIYIEFATKTSNPNFPPRVGLGGATTNQQESDPTSWFGITQANLHSAPFSPKDELARFQTLLQGDAPENAEQARQRIANWFISCVTAWSTDSANREDVRQLNWLLHKKLLPNQLNDKALIEIAQLAQSYRETEKRIQVPMTVNGMADLDPGYDYQLNIRGDYDQLGDPVPRGYLKVIAGALEKANAAETAQHVNTNQNNNSAEISAEVGMSEQSGRLELARLIADKNNPLTARVFVNRVWKELFGRGIVATPSNFGHLGQLPTHPELLDYLTTEFVNNKWSTKHLIRSIVLSETWQQSAVKNEQAVNVDPRNQWLHHFPLRRLEAESIRDAILMTSGRLDKTLYGPSVDPHRANEDSQKRLYSGPVDGKGRRSIYTKITIMEPPRFLALFNQPNPKLPTGKRDLTNTPAQSLALLNDPFVVEQADFWARRLVEQPHASAYKRLTEMFKAALGRSPDANELESWSGAVAEFGSLHQISDPADQLNSVEIWRDIAHSLFNLKEFIYVQ